MQPFVQEFVNALRNSGVVAEDDLQAVCQVNAPTEVLGFVRALIAARLLTRHQAFVALRGDVNDLILCSDGRYIVLERLGAGGTGEVYKARNEITDQIVAAKVFKRPAATHWRDRFRREIRLAARLVHPNIVPILDAREHKGAPLLVMACIEGTDLESHLENSGAIDVDLAIDIIRQVCLGLDFAHSRSMVHRDIKPGNLMLSEDGRVTILDFGLANLRETLIDDTGLTAGLFAAGTMDYMAPEQASNAKDVDPRADIYSLGCTLYHLLAGRPPYADEEDYVKKLIAHRTAETPRLESVGHGIPRQLVTCFEGMLAKRPDDRFQSVSEILQVLDTVPRTGSSATVSISHPTEPEKRLRNSLGMEFIAIEPGKFNMGSAEDESEQIADAGFPKHAVQLTHPFLLCVHLVTQELYQSVTNQNPSQYKAPDCPVENVSWLDAVRYANALSSRESLAEYYQIDNGNVTIAGGPGYRLPTEAEWEFACRAQTASPWHFGGDEDKLEFFAWTSRNADGHPHPVGQLISNQWGLHDMYGNVWEWCWDYYDELYYQYSEETDPMGPASGQQRVVRGGSFAHRRNCRSSTRTAIDSEENHTVGFRLARTCS